jgi:hypothetical protein
MRDVNRYKKKPSQIDGFFIWIKSNALTLIGFLLVAPLLYRYLRDQSQLTKIQNNEIKGENQIKENVDPDTRQLNANKITSNVGVQNSALELSHHLGTKYSDAGNWYDIFNPRGWTENDKKVLEILKYQVRNYHLVEKLYFEIYSKRRNLKDDVNKLLDNKQLEELKLYYNKYNTIW